MRHAIWACALVLAVPGGAFAQQAAGAPPMVAPQGRAEPYPLPDPDAAQPTPDDGFIPSEPLGTAPAPVSPSSAAPVVAGPPLDVDRVMDGAKRCWTSIPRVYGTEAQGGIARLRIKFTPEGRLDGPPMIIDKPQGSIGAKFAESAAAAVERCQPYRLPPERYAEWRQIEMRFDTIDPDNPPPAAVPPQTEPLPPAGDGAVPALSAPDGYVPSVPAPGEDGGAGGIPAPQ